MKGSDVIVILLIFVIVGSVIGVFGSHIWLLYLKRYGSPTVRAFARFILRVEMCFIVLLIAYGLIYHVDWSK